MKTGSGSLRMSIFGFAFFAALVYIPIPLAAQESAIIYHIEGSDFFLTHNEERIIVNADTLRRGGVNLENSGMISTGPGTFVEIQLIPSGALIKMAENSTLIYNGRDSGGGIINLGLVYGRIRVITAPGENAFEVNSGGVTVIVNDGDFGLDYYLAPDNFTMRPLLKIHSFRGWATAYPSGRGVNNVSFGPYSDLGISEGWSLTLDISSAFSFAERSPLEWETRRYWTAHNFSGISPRPGPNTIIREAAAAPLEAPLFVNGQAAQFQSQTRSLEELERRYLVQNRARTTTLFLGLILTAASVAVQGVAYSYFGTAYDDTAQNAFRGAYATLGLGLVCTLVGTLYNPRLEFR